MRRLAGAGLLALIIALQFAVAAERASVPPLDELLAQARQLAAAGRSADAYALLARAEDEYVGELRFDYALGRAALDAGHPARATLAFYRVLAVDPRHAGALIDSGRAYLALGNYQQARETFESLLVLDPPPALRVQIERYLEQTQRGLGSAPILSGYLTATLGKSTNVNQSPSQSQVFVPLFGARFDLSSQNQARADSFWSVGGGVDAMLPLDRTWALVGGAEILERQNFHESDFDLGGIGGRIGVSAGAGLDLVRVQWLSARNYLGHDLNRSVNALLAEGYKMLGPDDQLIAALQSGQIRYWPPDLQIFDADFTTLGLALSHRTGGSTILAAGLSLGLENDRGGNPDGDKQQFGVRASADVPVWAGLRAGISGAWLGVNYELENPAFLVVRRDRRSDAEVWLQYALAEALTAKVGGTWTWQRSNIEINEFDRRELWITLRREFR
jgi:tetratricopeptide (TPR) repeat protein